MSNSIDDKYQQCKRCVMDTTASDISFDDNGICNFCNDYIENSSHIIFEDFQQKKFRLNELVNKIKASCAGKKYDCIIGVSGGVDSSWTLVEAVRLGLKPLAVHMDNGWNSELAQNNIEKLVRELGVDLYTHVIDWEEYRKLMQSFFNADVIDVELLYDNAMLAVNYELAKKYNIKYILAGTNLVTEGMKMPEKWNWYKMDKRNILSIGRKSGVKKFNSFPAIGTLDYIAYRFIFKIEWVSFLDYLDFNKSIALDQLEQKFGYKRYPYKHYESVFTRFYQGYILPNKFGVDKRKLHLSTLVISNQLTRDEAKEMLSGIPYASETELNADIKYFLKKMDWSLSDLRDYISRKEVSHSNFDSEKKLFQNLIILRKYLSN